MSPLAWVVIAAIVTNGTVGLTRAALTYRTQKRNAEHKAQDSARKAAAS